MAAHYKWYPSSEEVVVPWNARYAFPSQANKAVKITPRIPPKNGAVFNPGNVIRVEFPAQGYVNPANTTLEFDVTLIGNILDGGSAAASTVRFQNCIQSVFSRARLLYGATPLEDIINYNVIVRNLTEWTGTTQTCTMDQTSVAEGTGGVLSHVTNGGLAVTALTNTRQMFIQGLDSSGATGGGYVPNKTFAGVAGTSASQTTRRYQISFAFGLFTQDKLLPVKFMASQLAIELTCAPEVSCILNNVKTSTGGTLPTGLFPTYQISNVNLIPEILEFDASYDAMFLIGLREGGVPIKFSSWHTFIFSCGGQANLNLQIQERSRSVKALFAVQRRAPETLYTDSGACFFESGGNTMTNYQFRIGGRYFPASPVQTALAIGTNIPNSGSEALIELQKALNVVGDYRLSTGINSFRWATPRATFSPDYTNTIAIQEADFTGSITGFSATGVPSVSVPQYPVAGNVGSACFAAAIDLETSNGFLI